MSPAPVRRSEPRGVARALGVAGRVALSFAVAGGFAAGGPLMLLLILTGSVSAMGTPFTATGLFAAGAGAGFLHGGILGFVGRGEGVGYAPALRGLVLSALLAVPAILLTWIPTLWTAMTTVALSTGRLSVLVGATLGWLFGIGVIVWAVSEARTAMIRVVQRWPEHRAGSVLVLLTFAMLLAAFLVTRPEIWWTDIEVSGLGAVILAIGATFWIATPIVVVVLHFLHQWLANSPISGR